MANEELCSLECALNKPSQKLTSLCWVLPVLHIYSHSSESCKGHEFLGNSLRLVSCAFLGSYLSEVLCSAGEFPMSVLFRVRFSMVDWGKGGGGGEGQ